MTKKADLNLNIKYESSKWIRNRPNHIIINSVTTGLNERPKKKCLRINRVNVN